MWAERSVFYQIYPLGFCGAPSDHDGVSVSRIGKVLEWTDQLLRLGVDAVYLGPVFESDRHGYDTRDYRVIDCRLGTNEEFARVCKGLHEAGIRVVLDGVFHHVGRGFFAFQDVLKNRENSRYRDWFFVKFDGENGYGDGLWYEGWEGHFELVKLNLNNPEVVDYLLESIRGWVMEFGIDGLRLDVAYCLEQDFLHRLRAFCQELSPDFFLLGELLHGDYNRLVNGEQLHSCTNYECYKGLFSSFNDLNLFEIAHSLNRQFGPEEWSLYKGKHLLCFVDNHDVNRIASVLKDRNHLPLIYGVLFAMPGIPCLYYGSEWGVEGVKQNGSDEGLRPCFEKPEANELTEWIAALAQIHRKSGALCFGGYRNVVLTNRQLIFERRGFEPGAAEEETVLCAVNADRDRFAADLSEYLRQRDWNVSEGRAWAVDLISGSEVREAPNRVELPGYSVRYLRLE